MKIIAYKNTPRGGKTLFMYLVYGTPAQLEYFKSVMGTHYQVDAASGQPIWFTYYNVGKEGTLAISPATETEPAKIYADQSMKRNVAGYIQEFGIELAKLEYPEFFANIGKEPVVPKPVTQPAENP